MQSILEKAYQTLAGENMANATTNLKGIVGTQGILDMGLMKEFGSSPLSFSSFQDLDLYGSGSSGELDHLQQNMDKPTLDGFMPINDTLCLGKKRPNPYSGNNGKSPLMWSDDLRLQDLGSCLGGPQDDPFKGDNQIQIAPPSLDDPISEIYDTKPLLQGDEKKFDGSMKLERPSPRRAPPLHAERMSPMITTGTMAQGRNSPFG